MTVTSREGLCSLDSVSRVEISCEDGKCIEVIQEFVQWRPTVLTVLEPSRPTARAFYAVVFTTLIYSKVFSFDII